MAMEVVCVPALEGESSMPRQIVLVLFVLVLVLCTAGAVSASPLDRETPSGAAAFLEIMDRFLSWLGRVLDDGNLLSVSGWDGSHLDPNGNPV